jgi:hypothetical protein
MEMVKTPQEAVKKERVYAEKTQLGSWGTDKYTTKPWTQEEKQRR